MDLRDLKNTRGLKCATINYIYFPNVENQMSNCALISASSG